MSARPFAPGHPVPTVNHGHSPELHAVPLLRYLNINRMLRSMLENRNMQVHWTYRETMVPQDVCWPKNGARNHSLRLAQSDFTLTHLRSWNPTKRPQMLLRLSSRGQPFHLFAVVVCGSHTDKDCSLCGPDVLCCQIVQRGRLINLMCNDEAGRDGCWIRHFTSPSL